MTTEAGRLKACKANDAMKLRVMFPCCRDVSS